MLPSCIGRKYKYPETVEEVQTQGETTKANWQEKKIQLQRHMWWRTYDRPTIWEHRYISPTIRKNKACLSFAWGASNRLCPSLLLISVGVSSGSCHCGALSASITPHHCSLRSFDWHKHMPKEIRLPHKSSWGNLHMATQREQIMTNPVSLIPSQPPWSRILEFFHLLSTLQLSPQSWGNLVQIPIIK